MSVVGWAVAGVILGLFSYQLTDAFPGKKLGAATAGLLGGMLGGLVFSVVAEREAIGLDAASLLSALAGAAVLVVSLRLIGRGRVTHQWSRGQGER